MRTTKSSRLLYLVLSVFLVFVLSGIAGAYEGGTAIFPFITSDSKNLTTLISIMVPDPDIFTNPSNVNCLHFRYFYKPMDAALTAPCNELDFWVATSSNDLMTFDVGGLIGGGFALFGDTDSFVTTFFGKALSLTDWIGPSSFIGYLTVEAAFGAGGGCDLATPVPGVVPDGEAVVTDLDQKTSWAYRAFSNYRHHDEQAILLNGYAAPTSWLPTNYVSTYFIVTPVDLDPNLFPQKSAVVKLMTGNQNLGGLWDRNELDYSQGVEQKVTCVGVVSIENLLAQVNAGRPELITQGGWSFLLNRTIVDQDLVNDAWIYKLETHTKIKGNVKPNCHKFPYLCPSMSAPEPFVNAVPNGGHSIQINQ